MARVSSMGWWKGVVVAVVAVVVVVDGTVTFTAVEDPLQPIWDQLDSLSGSIINGVKEEMQKFETRLQQKIDALNTKLNTLTTRSMGRNPAGPNNSQLNATFSSILDSFYSSRVREDTARAVEKIEQHVDNQITGLETRLRSSAPGASMPLGVMASLSDMSSTLDEETTMLVNITDHVVKINEKLGEGSGDGTCATLVDKVTELLAGAPAAASCPSLPPQTVEELRVALTSVERSPSFLPRDCSDHHWQHPEAPSGAYDVFPTMDPKMSVRTWCDMGRPEDKSSGGWTIIIRRQKADQQLSFNRTWADYTAGFGNEQEWWFGLSHLHALTYRQPYDLIINMHDMVSDNYYYAEYSTFRVADYSSNYTLVIDGFSGNVSKDAMAEKHHGLPFSTFERDNDRHTPANCAALHGGGWWFNACHYAALTATFPSSPNTSLRVIRWLNGNDWLVLDDVIVKIRPTNYAQRFNVHRDV